MRTAITILFLLTFGNVRAQLPLGATAGAGSLPELRADLVPEILPVASPISLRPGFKPGTSVPATHTATATSPERTVFDFGSTKPYLAFFCRLELDIEAATRFPVRFRLGEVRTWQQELTKRD